MAELFKKESWKNENRRKQLILLCFGILVCAIALTGMNGSLQNIDEVLYARVARETLEHNSWMIQYKDGEAWFHKSPMLFWGILLSYRLFGVSDFAAKLPSALSSIVTAFMILFISRKVFSSMKAGVIAAFIYLCSLQVYASTHQVATDSLLVGSLLTTLFFLIRGVRERSAWLFLTSVLNGMVFLTKSIYGLVIPVVLFIYIIVEKRYNLFFHLILMLIISIGISAPYFIYVYNTIPDVFVESFLRVNLLQRFYSGGDLRVGTLLLRIPYGVAYYTVVLLLFVLPFTPGIFFLFYRKNEDAPLRDIIWNPGSRVISIYFLAVLTGVSLLEGHWLHWSLSMIPPVCMLLGRVFDEMRKRSIFIMVAALSAVVIAVLLYAFITLQDTYPTYKDVVIGLIVVYAVVIASSLFIYFKRVSPERGMMYLVSTFFVAFTIQTAITVPLDFNPDLKKFSRVVYDVPSPLVVVSNSSVNEGGKTTATIWYLKMKSTQYGSVDEFKKAFGGITEGTYVMFYRGDSEEIRAMFRSFEIMKHGTIWNLGRIIEK